MRRLQRAPIFQAALARRPVRFTGARASHVDSVEPTTEKAHRFLRKTFQCALRPASFARPFVFLEIFSGRGEISAAVRRAAGADVCFDRRLAPELDVHTRAVADHLRGWILSGCASGIWIAPPANMADTPSLADQVSRIVSAALSRGAPFVIEGPAHARWWPLFDFLVSKGARHTELDFCQWGSRFRRPTVLLSVNFPPNVDLARKCSGRRGKCSCSGLPHIPMCGRSRACGQLWARPVKHRPPSLAFELAQWTRSAFVIFSGAAMSVICNG